MAIVPLPLPPGAEARALLHHLLEHGDVVGVDSAGRTIIQLAVDEWVLDKLMVSDAEAAELEDAGDAEPDADDEEGWLPMVLLEMAQAGLGLGVRSGRKNRAFICGTTSLYAVDLNGRGSRVPWGERRGHDDPRA